MSESPTLSVCLHQAKGAAKLAAAWAEAADLFVHDAAVRAGVNPLVFTWQIFAESSFNPNARSASGAEGIAQFMPETASGMGINPWNPTEALVAAANEDAGHLKQFAEQASLLAARYGATNSASATAWRSPPTTLDQARPPVPGIRRMAGVAPGRALAPGPGSPGCRGRRSGTSRRF